MRRRYVPSWRTDIRKTFRRIRREMAIVARVEASADRAQLRRVK